MRVIFLWGSGRPNIFFCYICSTVSDLDAVQTSLEASVGPPTTPNLLFDSRTPSFGLVDENSIVGKALYSYQFTNTPLSRRRDQGRQGRNDE